MHTTALPDLSGIAPAIPQPLQGAVAALVAAYGQWARDKASGTLSLELEVQGGGVRDKRLSTRAKI